MTGTFTVRSLCGDIAFQSLRFTAALLGVLFAAVSSPIAARAQTEGFRTIYSFQKGADGAYPYRGCIQAKDGNFYGTAGSFGANMSGVIYCIALDGTQTTLHNFGKPDANGVNTDGAYPYDTLVQGTDGNFYGTAPGGGTNGEGTIFKITPGGAFTTLYSFEEVDANTANTNGARPYCSLVQAGDGNFYGVTIRGGTGGSGVVFKVTPAGAYTRLHTFAAIDSNRKNLDGAFPDAALFQAADGFLYGTVNGGGANGNGTIFKISTAGAFSTLHVFTDSSSGATNADGAFPACPLIQGADGALYGLAYGGGTYAHGTVFKVTTGGMFTTLWPFGPTTNGLNVEGINPNSGLLLGADGLMYGTCYRGGANGEGTIFSIIPSTGAITPVHQFTARSFGDNLNDDGSQPGCALIQGKNGEIYGTASAGGTANAGTIYGLTLPLRTFPSINKAGTPALGEALDVSAPLFEGSDGLLYGTSTLSAGDKNGTVFRLAKDGTKFTYLHQFTPDGASNTDGSYPVSGVCEGADGNFYGTTQLGGANKAGTIYKIARASGAFSLKYTFAVSNADGPNPYGYAPNASLVAGRNGLLYGTAFSGGDNSSGTVFSFAPAIGEVHLVHAFSTLNSQDQTNGDGAKPYGPVMVDTAGNIIGTTLAGGSFKTGVIFKVDAQGNFTTLHTFYPYDAAGSKTSLEGAGPRGGLVQTFDGYYYGTCSAGGKYGSGTIYRVGLDRSFQVLHHFSVADSDSANGDGLGSYASLVQADDGNFYGTASRGGYGGRGTVFSMSPSGVFSVLPVLQDPEVGGMMPLAGVIVGSDGWVYGTSSFGGAGGAGTLFRFNPAYPQILSSTANTVNVGAAYSYGIRIAAGAVASRYVAYGLAPGLKFNQATGMISGAPTKAGTYSVTLGALAFIGTDYQVLKITVKGTPPVITSATTAAGQVGKVFSYTITATNSPTMYGQSGVPAGLKINQTTGVISGTPTAAGTYTVTIAAFNASGSGSAKLALTIKPPSPVVTSALTASATLGVAFSYQITATNSPASYGAAGLPGGLTINQTTGKISGTPTKAGTYAVTIAAFNSGGSGSAKLTLMVKPAS